MNGNQSWSDPGQSRESGGSRSEHATYATQGSHDPQPSPQK